jgi:hypothetical protein
MKGIVENQGSQREKGIVKRVVMMRYHAMKEMVRVRSEKAPFEKLGRGLDDA